MTDDTNTETTSTKSLLANPRASWFTPILVGVILFVYQLESVASHPQFWWNWLFLVITPLVWTWLLHEYGKDSYKAGVLDERLENLKALRNIFNTKS